MGILTKLEQQGSTLSSNNGATPSTPDFAGSTLHNLYSVNGTPVVSNKPSPSNLDLNGQTPSKYLNNLPE